MNRLGWTMVALLGIVCALVPVNAADPPKKVGPDPATWDKTVDNAIKFLKTAQDNEGAWSKMRSPGVTGVVIAGIVSTGRVPTSEPVVAKGLKYIESLVNPKAGHIAGADPKVQLQNYVTSVNVLALTKANSDAYKEVIGDAAKFLKKLQWDEEEGKKKDNDYYGGAGYDSKSRPDLSNTQFFLDALKAAGVDKDDPAFKRAIVFVTRCQNYKGEEGNDQAWAGKFNDGSFIYSAAEGGQSKADDKEPVGYGSMTYAGIKSLIYCGVSKDDPRIKKAMEWVKKHYTLDRNPGMPEGRDEWGLYYYYHSMAKCFDALGIDEFEDAKGVKHDWRKELTEALAKRQKPNGSWVNEQDRWMEGDPNLVTGYALMTLSYCKPKK